MTMTHAADARPHLLLIEDDPTSQRFMATVLEAIPARVSIAGSYTEALLQGTGHDLWLIDVNLPDGRGDELLAALRVNAADTPAIAHTADASADMRERMLAAGFNEVLVKPMAATQLRNAARQALFASFRQSAPVEVPAALPSSLPDWDDDAALRALGGQLDNLKALRGLFLGELRVTAAAVEQAVAESKTGEPGPAARPPMASSNAAAMAAGNHTVAADQRLRDHLHRLKASCGYVGAARLAAAVEGLRQQPASAEALAGFQDAVANLLSA
ncbi:response regulator [Pseudoxanthomonas dokdonensis]